MKGANSGLSFPLDNFYIWIISTQLSKYLYKVCENNINGSCCFFIENLIKNMPFLWITWVFCPMEILILIKHIKQSNVNIVEKFIKNKCMDVYFMLLVKTKYIF